MKSTFIAAALLAIAGTTQAQTMLGGGKGATSFPITITQPGTYKLAGNLVVPDANTSAIVVKVPNVTIDLNGFGIVGPVDCMAACTHPAGNVNGIEATQYAGVYAYNLQVMNGSVRGFTGYGIRGFGQFTNLRLSHNATGGINAGESSIVDRVVATFNGTQGIYASRSTVMGSSAVANKGVGFRISGGLLTHSVASTNAGPAATFHYQAAYMQNVFDGNNGGAISGGTSMGQNLCGTTAC